jgi:DNA invertase Pin-like site-specific DNA recombinase
MERPTIITSEHLALDAAVYGRQSSGVQVEKHTGSTAYQKAQADWPLRWGWPAHRIRRFEDFGLSGTGAVHRPEYMRLRVEIRARKIAAVFVSDVTRLGRDAQELLDFIRECIAFNVLIVVDGKILDVRDTNQRFTTGMLALLAEFDGLSRRDTLNRGRLAKLEDRKAVSPPPAGYVVQTDRSWIKDPDPQVRDGVRAVFREFLRHRTLRATVVALKDLHLKIPRQKPGWRVRLAEPAIHMVHDMLRHPAYKGDYVYRRKVDDHTKARSEKGRYRPRLARDGELVVIPNHHEPYVTEEEWNEIERILRTNGWSRDHANVGGGHAQAQGLVRCSKHRGRVMCVHYKRGPGHKSFSYRCRGDYNYGGAACDAVPGRPIEQAVVAAAIERLSAPNLSALKEALGLAIADSYATRRQRQGELERLRREADDLEQKVAMLDAGSHGVFKRLEARLEDASDQMARLESSIADDPGEFRRDGEMLTELIELVKELPNIWNAETTTNRDRKELVRLLVHQVVIETCDKAHVGIRIDWIGEAQPTRRTVWRTAGALERINTLASEGASAATICEQLRRLEARTIRGNEWSVERVTQAIWQMRRRGALPRLNPPLDHSSCDLIARRAREGVPSRLIAEELCALGARTIAGNAWSTHRVQLAIGRMRRSGRLERRQSQKAG